MTRFKPGDWVIITHKHKPLCIMGRVIQNCVMDGGNAPGIEVADIVHYDPLRIDSYQPGKWPEQFGDLQVERCGPDVPV